MGTGVLFEIHAQRGNCGMHKTENAKSDARTVYVSEDINIAKVILFLWMWMTGTGYVHLPQPQTPAAGQMLLPSNTYNTGQMLLPTNTCNAGQMLLVLPSNTYNTGKMLLPSNTVQHYHTIQYSL